MQISPDQVQAITNTIVQDLNTAADFAGILDPALVPFIAIGQAMDKHLPGFAASVASWIAGNPPTDAEKQDFVNKLAALSNPDAP